MPSDDSSWILSLIVMEQYNGEPGALRGACPVLREDCANLPPKGGKAALSYSTPSSMQILTQATGNPTFTLSGDRPTTKKRYGGNLIYGNDTEDSQ